MSENTNTEPAENEPKLGTRENPWIIEGCKVFLAEDDNTWVFISPAGKIVSITTQKLLDAALRFENAIRE